MLRVLASALLDGLLGWGRAVAVGAAVVAAVLLASRLLFFRREGPGRHGHFYRQAFSALAWVAGLFALVLAAPIHHATRGHVLSLLGILLSAVVALASPSVVSNALSGFVLRWQKAFHRGDFLSVDGKLGRVVQIGLFGVQLQDQERNRVFYPNSYLLSRPVVVHSGATLVTASVSLGYDVHHRDAEGALLDAARRAGLEQPFVFVEALGDHTVSYRVFGLLRDARYLVQVRSDLKRAVLDALHGSGIEVMSPFVVAERSLEPGQRLTPSRSTYDGPVSPGPREVERLMFLEADLAETAERLAERLQQVRDRLKTLRKRRGDATDRDSKGRLDEEIRALERYADRLESRLSELDGGEAGSDV